MDIAQADQSHCGHPNHGASGHSCAPFKSRIIKPIRLLDPFCCEGGASEGYSRAGFHVYGIDLFKHTNRQGKRVGFSRERYPFPAHQGDALEAIRSLLEGRGLRFYWSPEGWPDTWETLHLSDFDAIHASPPCQHASAGTRTMRKRGTSEHPALIEPTRQLLDQTGLPWVIENVSGAALRDPITLCGSHFGLTAHDEDDELLRLERHRLFEANWPVIAPGECSHDPAVSVGGVYGGARARKAGQTPAEHRHDAKKDRGGGYVPRSKKVQQKLLGIDWMTKGGMAQALPPAYTEWVGVQLMDHVLKGVAA